MSRSSKVLNRVERCGRIRASVQQMLDFLQPGGVITNKCRGACDAAIPFEQPAAGLCVPPP